MSTQNQSDENWLTLFDSQMTHFTPSDAATFANMSPEEPTAFFIHFCASVQTNVTLEIKTKAGFTNVTNKTFQVEWAFNIFDGFFTVVI